MATPSLSVAHRLIVVTAWTYSLRIRFFSVQR